MITREGKSDIDFVSVINRDITPDEMDIIREIHKEISSKYPKKVLEGSYVTLQHVRNLNKDIGQFIYFDGEKCQAR